MQKGDIFTILEIFLDFVTSIDDHAVELECSSVNSIYIFGFEFTEWEQEKHPCKSCPVDCAKGFYLFREWVVEKYAQTSFAHAALLPAALPARVTDSSSIAWHPSSCQACPPNRCAAEWRTRKIP